MPFKSKAQWDKFFAMAERGKIPKNKAEEWARETKTPYEELPEKAPDNGEKTSAEKLGVFLALHDTRFIKEAVSAATLKNLARYALPALGGAALGTGATYGIMEGQKDELRNLLGQAQGRARSLSEGMDIQHGVLQQTNQSLSHQKDALRKMTSALASALESNELTDRIYQSIQPSGLPGIVANYLMK